MYQGCTRSPSQSFTTSSVQLKGMSIIAERNACTEFTLSPFLYLVALLVPHTPGCTMLVLFVLTVTSPTSSNTQPRTAPSTLASSCISESLPEVLFLVYRLSFTDDFCFAPATNVISRQTLCCRDPRTTQVVAPISLIATLRCGTFSCPAKYGDALYILLMPVILTNGRRSILPIRRLEYGELLIHPGTIVHGGVDITSGKRYLMIMFCHTE